MWRRRQRQIDSTRKPRDPRSASVSRTRKQAERFRLEAFERVLREKSEYQFFFAKEDIPASCECYRC